MGLLDTILASLGASGTSAENPAQAAGTGSQLVGVVGDLINQHGGLQGLMGLFAKNGLGEVFSSWVGVGDNKEISAEQIQKVLGEEHVAALAQKFGIEPAAASEMMAQYLPKIVDKLTPAGEVDPNHDVAGGLSALVKGGLGKLLG